MKITSGLRWRLESQALKILFTRKSTHYLRNTSFIVSIENIMLWQEHWNKMAREEYFWSILSVFGKVLNCLKLGFLISQMKIPPPIPAFHSCCEGQTIR